MIKKLINSLKNQPIMDPYFGEMKSVYDKFECCYYLDKDIELESIYTPVILYIELNDQKSTNSQQVAFEKIKQNFSKIWIDAESFLIHDKKIITEEHFRKEFRLESLIIPIDNNKSKMEWELNLLNLNDGFSRIIVEMKYFEPFNFSVEA